MTNGIGTRMNLGATHNSHHARAFNIAESGTAFLLGNLAATYKSPP
jgi:hypothetical protein